MRPSLLSFFPPCTMRYLMVHLSFWISILCFLSIRNLNYDIWLLQNKIIKKESEKVLINETVPNNLSNDEEDLIVFYNRIPKSGSTTLVGISKDLTHVNKFHSIYIEISKKNHRISLSEQERLITNITKWHSKKRAFYHGHLAFIDFTKFGIGKNPIYINMARRPLDRLISSYYFLRNGDDYEGQSVARKLAGDNTTFDECVEIQGDYCNPKRLWFQIPYFCGQNPDCWIAGNPWALEQAKHNVIKNYLIVGITEEIGDFITLLEVLLPSFYSGATDIFKIESKGHLRKTANKAKPKLITVAKFLSSPIWRMEAHFYEFVKKQFYAIKDKIFKDDNGTLTKIINQFHYSKIVPHKDFK